jgi:hypothetical protein
MPAWKVVRDGISTYYLAHWFLMLLFLVPWSGWLTWRWRRLSRLQRENEAQLDA